MPQSLIPETLRHLAVPIASLRPYPKNPRLGDTDAIRDSLAQHGQYRAICVRQEDNTILAGNHTYFAACELGWDSIAATFVNVDDEEAARIVLVDNRTNDLARGYDDGLLLELLRELPSLEGTGYDEQALNELVASVSAAGQMPLEDTGDPDSVPEPPAEPTSKLGDLWLLGNHRLLVGDAFAVTDVDRLLGSKRPSLILTDPPYGMYLDTDFSTIKGMLKSVDRAHGTQGNTYEPVIGDHDDFDPAPIMALFEDVHEQFWWGADYYAERIPKRGEGSWLVWDKRKESQADGIGSEFELCWSRQKHKRRMMRHDWFGFLSSRNTEDARNRVHPTQKPVSLLIDILEQWGKPGNIVLDLFGGSGSTLISCEKSGRTALVMELSEPYADTICKRYQRQVGIKPILEATGESVDFLAGKQPSPGMR